ncbi:MAG: hypothetical protein HY209_00780 [Candidatus Omnitrophica bacterium]|nr:hypothetical protein [Candidatus Omnitrophota bacterium]
MESENLLTFFKNLFQFKGFDPHGECFLWRPDIIWTHVLADSVIAFSYFSIPIALVYFVVKRKDLAFKWIFVAFGIFIVACGATHVMDVRTIWVPMYRLDGIIRVFTALVSVATAVVVWPLIPLLLRLPSPEQLQRANEALHAANTKITEHEKVKSDFFSIFPMNSGRL